MFYGGRLLKRGSTTVVDEATRHARSHAVMVKFKRTLWAD